MPAMMSARWRGRRGSCGSTPCSCGGWWILARVQERWPFRFNRYTRRRCTRGRGAVEVAQLGAGLRGARTANRAQPVWRANRLGICARRSILATLQQRRTQGEFSGPSRPDGVPGFRQVVRLPAGTRWRSAAPRGTPCGAARGPTGAAPRAETVSHRRCRRPLWPRAVSAEGVQQAGRFALRGLHRKRQARPHPHHIDERQRAFRRRVLQVREHQMRAQLGASTMRQPFVR